ncbi:MAG: 4-hydroxy-tetrahydrodipicolinate reductase [Alphaproteobacteria bacterium]|nr:4-hydroxy-tetrahydrodipicolinate reductase [Alphaproteobacteria bacterium]
MRIGVVGAAGRMGQMLVREIVATTGAAFGGGTENPSSPSLGRDVGEIAGLGALQSKLGADPAALFGACEAVIDFTAPAATCAHAALAASNRKVLVIGTTGVTADDQKKIDAAARSTAIVQSTNFSLGVNLAFALVEEAARRLGPDYDIEIFEAHHKHKVDAPSGTALSLGRAAAKGRGLDFAKDTVRARDGHTGARPAGPIGFSVARGGSEIGEHTVMFMGDGERLEIAHKAQGRQVYAKGAVRAALWAQGKAPGLYSMRDVLGL